MRFLPAVINIQRVERGRKKLRLCLPVFLLWPFALILTVMLTPVLVVLGSLYPFLYSVRRFFWGICGAISFGCSLKGLNLAIKGETGTIQINII